MLNRLKNFIKRQLLIRRDRELLAEIAVLKYLASKGYPVERELGRNNYALYCSYLHQKALK